MFTSRLRAAARYVLLVAAVFSIGAPATDASSAAGASSGEQITASHGRLRKLHLVRPDLIPYPMAYDVYC